jgi:hypothetical protein
MYIFMIHFLRYWSHLIPSLPSKPTKVARRFLEDGSRVRVSKSSGALLPKPDPLARLPPRSNVAGPKDTAPQDAFKVTFSDYETYLPYIYAKLKIANDNGKK